MKSNTAVRSRLVSKLLAVTLAVAAVAVVVSPARAADLAQRTWSLAEHLCHRFCGCHHHHHGHEWCNGHEHFWCPGHH